MKRWMVLLIIFAVMGGMIVMSGCTSEDFAWCLFDMCACTVDSSDSCVRSCWETCFDCSWINNVECSGSPCQWCLNCGVAFQDACQEKHVEDMKDQNR